MITQLHHGVKALKTVEKLTKIGATMTLMLPDEIVEFEYAGINFKVKRIS